jgi:SAM-dependent methyltransferase
MNVGRKRNSSVQEFLFLYILYLSTTREEQTLENGRIANMRNHENPFETHVAEYDQWFDSDNGSRIFLLELDCLQQAIDTTTGRWLEVGVGSGRFAHALGIETGIDTSLAMVKISTERGINACVASGDNLPFDNASFDGVLLACTVCFLHNPQNTLKECWRILRDGGDLAIGFVPANSLWGRYHAMRGKQGHLFYSSARFYMSSEIRSLAESVGLTYRAEHGSTLPFTESLSISEEEDKHPLREESFVVLSFFKTNESKGDRK